MVGERRARRRSAVATKTNFPVAAFSLKLQRFFSCVHAFLRYFENLSVKSPRAVACGVHTAIRLLFPLGTADTAAL
ncbi:MAG: hypothetical protein DMF03_02715 [Verrucomicrobia bacterium]|nr:MAG: hypothetical protein DMF03_02715 [Verrucomicrobiota bacterium]